MKEPGRNEPCPCGSGKKYKKCCLTRSGAGGLSPKILPFEELQADLARVDAMSNRIPALIDQGRTVEALDAANRLLEEYPQDPDGIERMAEVLEARGEAKDAARWYRKAAYFHLEQDPVDGREPADYYLEQADRLDPGETAE